MTYSGSRDSKAQAEAGQKAAAALGDQLRAPKQGPLYRTRTVTELNPEWVKANPTPAPKPKAPEERPPLIETIRTGIGLPAEGIGPGILRGIQDGFANAFGLGGSGRPGTQARSRGPLSVDQIRQANSSSQNHNAAALAAINQGKRSYSVAGGPSMPTTAMNGKVRNTYGDTGGSLVG